MKKKLFFLVLIGLVFSAGISAAHSKMKPPSKEGALGTSVQKVTSAPLPVESFSDSDNEPDTKRPDTPRTKKLSSTNKHGITSMATVKATKNECLDGNEGNDNGATAREGVDTTEPKEESPETGGWLSVIATKAAALVAGETREIEFVPTKSQEELTPKEAADKKTNELCADIKELEDLLADTPNTEDQTEKRKKITDQIGEKEAEIVKIADTYKTPDDKHSYLKKGDGPVLTFDRRQRVREAQAIKAKEKHAVLRNNIAEETKRIANITLPELKESRAIEFHKTKAEEIKALESDDGIEEIKNTPDASKEVTPQIKLPSRAIVTPYSVQMETQKIKKGEDGNCVEIRVPVYKKTTKFDYGAPQLNRNDIPLTPEQRYETVIQELNTREIKAKLKNRILNAAGYQYNLKTKKPLHEGKAKRESLKKRVLEQNIAATLSRASLENLEKIQSSKQLRKLLKRSVLSDAFHQHQLALALNTVEGHGLVTELDPITISTHQGSSERKAELKEERDRTRIIKQELERQSTTTANTKDRAATAIAATDRKLKNASEQLKELSEKVTTLKEQRDAEIKTLAHAKIIDKQAQQKVETYNKNRQPLVDAHNGLSGISWLWRS